MSEFEPAMSQFVSRHDYLEAMVGYQATEIDRLRAEVAHWKANHDQMAERNAIFRQRPDLPADRIEMVKRLDELRAEIKGWEAFRENILAEHTEIANRLRAELETLHEEFNSTLNTHGLAMETLRAECEGLRADLEKQYAVANEYMLDAERYRWLAHRMPYTLAGMLHVKNTVTAPRDDLESDLRDMIDAAMRPSGETK